MFDPFGKSYLFSAEPRPFTTTATTKLTTIPPIAHHHRHTLPRVPTTTTHICCLLALPLPPRPTVERLTTTNRPQTTRPPRPQLFPVFAHRPAWTWTPLTPTPAACTPATTRRHRPTTATSSTTSRSTHRRSCSTIPPAPTESNPCPH